MKNLSFLAVLGLSLAAQANQTPSSILIGAFEKNNPSPAIPLSWKPMTFEKIKKRTEYSVETNENLIAIKAVSSASASGLVNRVSINPKEYPIISWRWKILNTLKNGDVRKKSGDDYAARIYITFKFPEKNVGFLEKAKFSAARLIWGDDLPYQAISYIWANKAKVGTITPNPYTDHVKMFAIQSGEDKTGQWLTEERNIFEDFRLAFGANPPQITSVAIMSDSDNTGESTIAYYCDIIFKQKQLP